MPDLHLPSIIAGAIVGPFLWAFAALTAFIVLAFIGDALERLVNR